VLQYEIKVEKGAAAPFRIVTWVYQYDDVHFAIHCKVLEDHYDKHKSTFRSTLKSFGRIEREKAADASKEQLKAVREIVALTPESDEERRARLVQRLLRAARGESPVAELGQAQAPCLHGGRGPARAEG
jgi:hypothetical protein